MDTGLLSAALSGLPPELRSITPCVVGRALLKDFAEQSPLAAPSEPSLYQAFGGDPLWRAFTRHWTVCETCQLTCDPCRRAGTA